MTLFEDKYRVEPARLKNWDYSANGAYYLTLCVKNRDYVFGHIDDNKIILSELGKKAEQCWRDIPNHFSFVKLDEFVIMPNHIHGILIIDKPVETQHLASPILASPILGSPILGSPILGSPILGSPKDFSQREAPEKEEKINTPRSLEEAECHETKKNKFGRQSQNIGSVIRGFKIGVTKYAKKNFIDFAWQARFYDHVIRNEEDLFNIRQYIINNPMNWSEDEFHLDKK